jgi:hypothetical protein
LVEHGIGETRALLVDKGRIIEAQVELEGAVPAGTILTARVTNIGRNGRNAIAKDERGTEYLLPNGARPASEGASITIEVTREAIPGNEPWKRSLARLADKLPGTGQALEQRLCGTKIRFPDASDALATLGWNELVEEARSGVVRFAGGELRISLTPAMTLIDVDGHLPAEELSVIGAGEAARAIRRLDIGGSIGIDLPTVGSKALRQASACAIDGVLAQPFERTGVNGFGFIQVVRPRRRPSLLELAQDQPAFEARALLRRLAFEPAGAKRIVANSAVIKRLQERPAWLDSLALQLGGNLELRADPSLPMSGGYAETL